MPMPPLPPIIQVTPPNMPPLPAQPAPQIPMGGTPRLPDKPGGWASAREPSTQLVQKQYIDTRLKELKAISGFNIAAALFVIEQMLLEKIPQHKRPRIIPTQELERIYRAIEKNLQSAELTVNFKADTWFTNPNTYDTYTQMYQRAVQANGMILQDTAQNQADTRANVDNHVTFPKNWQQGTAPVAVRGRSLGLGLNHPGRIQNQMDTGTLNDIRLKPTDLASWTAGNRHFNPNTKQIFLALNYGRRPHGSSTNYGWSYFVGKQDLKPKCLYYSRDTFHTGTVVNPLNVAVPLLNHNVDAGTLQIPFNNLGAIIGHEGRHIRKDIFASCYEGQTLKDITVTGAHADYLLEAHHFGEMTFNEHVEYMVISLRSVSDPALWRQIVTNATTFTKRNGIRLFQTD
jgi:hypothetical protein